MPANSGSTRPKGRVKPPKTKIFNLTQKVALIKKDADNAKFIWSYEYTSNSTEGPWPLKKASMNDFGGLISKFQEVEKNSDNHFDTEKSHVLRFKKLSEKAKSILQEMGSDETGEGEIPQIYSFYVSKKARIICLFPFLVGKFDPEDGHVQLADSFIGKNIYILRILWWDPNHEVSPSQK